MAATSTALLLLGALSGCGLPGGTDVRTVDDDSVPYRLLEPEEPSDAPTADGAAPRGAPVVFWLRRDLHLVPTASTAACADPTEEVVSDLLDVLESPPDEGERSSGRSSGVPPSSDLDLVEIEDGEALVALRPATSITADRLPLAVGQMVLTVTSAPGVDSVRLSIDGDVVQVPLPGGALTSRSVTADDYAGLVAERFVTGDVPLRLLPGIGCPPQD